MNATAETGLVPSVSVANLAAVRDAIHQKIEQASKLLVEAEALMEANKLAPLRYYVGDRYSNAVNAMCRGDSSETTKYVDAQMWERLLKESGLRTFMNSDRRKEWDVQICERKVPAFTPGNVVETFKAIHGQRQDMLEEGVVAIFKRLSWCYKTNNPRMFGKKIIMNSFLTSRGGYTSFHDAACNNLDDLTRVFYLVNGKPEPDHRCGTYSACVDARRAGQSTLEMKYLKLRWYKKGTVHVEFKDLDVVAAMNRMVARAYPNALPPAV